MLRKSLCASLVAGLLIVGTVKAESKDIVDTAVAAGSFKTLVAAAQAAGLVDALKAEGPITVFAPTDEAFAKLPEGTVESLLEPKNKQQLVDILTYHVVAGRVPAEKVVSLNGAKSLNGQQIDIKVDNGEVSVDQAKVIKTDIACSNGIIHVIDQVMLPARDDISTTAGKAGNFKTLLTAIKAAGLAEAFMGKGPFTVFAPTDEAFAKLPKLTLASLLEEKNRGQLVAILKFHVVSGRIYSSDAVAAGTAETLQGSPITIRVSGGQTLVNDAKLVATDIDASNGVIHVIDTVLLPSSKEQASNGHPRDMIVKAINAGAPLYNAHQPASCAGIYKETMAKLMTMKDAGLSHHTREVMEQAMVKVQSTSCPHTQAWTLRHALDLAYSDLK